jgi:hypothetical protein
VAARGPLPARDVSHSEEVSWPLGPTWPGGRTKLDNPDQAHAKLRTFCRLWMEGTAGPIWAVEVRLQNVQCARTHARTYEPVCEGESRYTLTKSILGFVPSRGKRHLWYGHCRCVSTVTAFGPVGQFLST